jgi:hypothetical protein
MKTLNFKHRGHLPILFKNTPRSKALEPVCLFRPPLPPIVTQSPGERGRMRGQVALETNCFKTRMTRTINLP